MMLALMPASEEHVAQEAVPVFVMLPLDTINADGVFRYARAPWFAAALQLLANSGVHGVAVDVWWSAVEASPRCYNWAGYRQLLEMLRPTGLKLQAVLSFHACGGNVGDLVQIPLPHWVLQAGEMDPDIFFTDRPRQGAGLGQRNKEYISFWADEEPVLFGRTPVQCYEEFMSSFAEAFAADLGGLVEEVVVGMGPCGELRFPSYVEANGWRFPGVGEFQCYDRRALASLAAAARERGRPEWGYGGPHDSGEYNSSPNDTGFFARNGSWESDYGDFFLSWYSAALYQHGERLLSAASRALGRFRRPGPAGALGRGAEALLRRMQSAAGGVGWDAFAAASAGAGAPAGAEGTSEAACVGADAGACASPASSCSAPRSRNTPFAEASAAVLSQENLMVAVGAQVRACGSQLQCVDECEPAAGFDVDSVAPASSAASVQTQQSLQLQAQSYACLASSIFSTLASPVAAAAAAAAAPSQQPPAAALAAQLESRGSGSMECRLSELMGRMGLFTGASASGSPEFQGTPARRSQEGPRDSSSSGGTDAAGAGPAGDGDVADGVDGGLSGPLIGSVLSLESLPAAAAAPEPPCPCRSPSPPPPRRCGGAAPLAGLLNAADAGSMSTLTDSTDAMTASGSVAPTPQGGLTPKRCTLDASVGSISPGAGAAPLAAAAAAVTAAVTAAVAAAHGGGDAAAAAAAAAQSGVLEKFLSGVAGMGGGVEQLLGGDAAQLLGGAAAAAAAAAAWRASQGGWRRGGGGLSITAKIAGVHWWYNSSSHASELTAGYYNTDTRDGYAPLLELCARYGANVTLTCVEMCDEQHPRHARCGPEGLLRQIRAAAARLGVPLGGENALRIFLVGGGIDAAALGRIVDNTCAWAPGAAGRGGGGSGGRGGQLMHSSSWPCARMREQQLVQQQYTYPGQYASAGGAASDQLQAPTHYYGSHGSLQGHRANSEVGYWVQTSGIANGGGAGSGSSGGLMYGPGTLAAAAPSATGPLSSLSAGPAGPAHFDHHHHHLLRHQQQQHQHQQQHRWSTQQACASGCSSSGGSCLLQQSGYQEPVRGSFGGRTHIGAAGGAGGKALPAMCAFTFLRLGPEILDHQGQWMQFMFKMQNAGRF